MNADGTNVRCLTQQRAGCGAITMEPGRRTARRLPSIRTAAAQNNDIWNYGLQRPKSGAFNGRRELASL